MNYSHAFAMAALGICGLATLSFAINIYTKTKNSCRVDSYRHSLRGILIVSTIAITLAISYYICHFSCGSFAYPEDDDDYHPNFFVRFFRSGSANLYLWFLSGLGIAMGVSLWIFSNKFMDGMKTKGCPNTPQVQTSITFIRMIGILLTIFSIVYFAGKFVAVFISGAEKSGERANERHLDRIEKTAQAAERRKEKAKARRDKEIKRQKAITTRNEAILEEARYKAELEAERKGAPPDYKGMSQKDIRTLVLQRQRDKINKDAAAKKKAKQDQADALKKAQAAAAAAAAQTT